LPLTIAALFQGLPLRLPYSAIVSAICFVMQRLPRGTALLVDNTWVDKGVYDMLRHEGQAPIGVTITGGDQVNWEEGHLRVTVPKATLVSKLIALTHSGTLSIHGGLADWPALKHEMEIFRPEITPSGRETWNAARSGHDDLLTAAALCAWYAQQDDMHSWGFYELARMRAQRPEDTHEDFVCACDIGQSSDPTTLCVMSRLDGEDPRRDRFFEPVEPPMQPESTADAGGYIGSSEWFSDLDSATKAMLHREEGSPLTGPLAIRPASARRSRRYAEPRPGNLEWLELEAEHRRYAALLCGRDPEPGEQAEHESNLKTIREAHHAV
jgi:hypothetical protein